MRRAAGPPVVMTVAGSDNSAGAGIQADLRTIRALGGYGLTAVTCVVAEVPGRVEVIQAVRSAVVEAQVRLGFEAFPVGAVKTGMLYSAGILRAVVGALRERVAGGVPLVVDPVMVASSGDALLKPSAVRAYREELIPMATLVTPNVDELAILAGRVIGTAAEMELAGRDLVEQSGVAFLLKGGHLKGRFARDVLVMPGGTMREFVAPFVRGVDPHGTGCTYSAAIAMGLARGWSLEDAVGGGKEFITGAIRGRFRWGTTEVLGF